MKIISLKTKILALSVLLTLPGAATAEPVWTLDEQVESASATLSQNLASQQAAQAEFSQRQAIEQARVSQIALQRALTPAGGDLGQGSIAWLTNQDNPAVTGFTPVAGREGLLVSFNIPENDPLAFLRGRSWTYDNAIGAIALLLQGNTADALSILLNLREVEDFDGSFAFSYQIDSGAFDNKVRTGTLAWVGYAMALYQNVTGDKRFQTAATKIATRLQGFQLNSGSLKGGPDVSWVSTEHNVDAYFFFRELYRATNKGVYRTTANKIKNSLLANHWTGSATTGHFLQGIGDPTAAMDANALGALFLSAIGRNSQAQSALNYVEATFANQQTVAGSTTTVTGYSPDAARQTVWVEGSLTTSAAYYRAGNVAKAESIWQNVGAIQDTLIAQGKWTGALPFAVNRYSNPDGDTYAEWESVSSTSWLLINLALESGDTRFMNRD